MASESVSGRGGLPTELASVADRIIFVVFGLNMTECLVSTGGSKMAKVAGKHFPEVIFVNVRFDGFFSGSKCL